MKEISKDLLTIKFNDNDTLEMCMNYFYDIMRKYDIKQGTPYSIDGKVGVTCDNYEWTVCKYAFLQKLKHHLSIKMMFHEKYEDSFILNKENIHDLFVIKFNNTDTLKTCATKFFEIIKQHGVIENAKEIMYRETFLTLLENHIVMQMLFGTVPNDLKK